MNRFNTEEERVATLKNKMEKGFIHPKFSTVKELAIDLITEFFRAKKNDVINHIMLRYDINQWNANRAWKIFRNFKKELKAFEESSKNTFIPKTILIKNRK